MTKKLSFKISNSWKKKLEEEFKKKYFTRLSAFLEKEYKNKNIFPKKDQIFKALNLTSFKKTKVIILGQDPYHGLKQAHGLAFCVSRKSKMPPSLKNIFKNIKNDLNKNSACLKSNSDFFLENLSSQGVLLLNSVLTVQEGLPNSHQNKGWEKLTDKIIDILSEEKENLVFLLWGNDARKKGININRKKHLVLESPHPSPLSAFRGFFNNKHFSKTNNYLEKNNIKKINW